MLDTVTPRRTTPIVAWDFVEMGPEGRHSKGKHQEGMSWMSERILSFVVACVVSKQFEPRSRTPKQMRWTSASQAIDFLVNLGNGRCEADCTAVENRGSAEE